MEKLRGIVVSGSGFRNARGIGMQLFHLHTVDDEHKASGTRTWLIIAGNLFEAMSLIPDGYTATAAEVQAGAVLGAGRVIGWMGPPFLATTSARSQPERIAVVSVRGADDRSRQKRAASMASFH